MGNIVVMYIRLGGSISIECDNLENLDWVMAEMEKRGFQLGEALSHNDIPAKDNTRELADDQDDPWRDVRFCPVHGDKKRWADTKDGGHYCGEKNPDKSWCGYKENEAGQQVKPPKTLPNYVKF